MTPPSGAAPEAVRVPHPIGIRELEVLRTARLTPRMHRVVLGGPALDGFESHHADEHVKLVFPDPDTGLTRAPTRRDDGMYLDWPKPFPPTREYTIRAYRPDEREIDIDFVVHPGGLASTWATTCAPGDRLWVAGPPGGIAVPDAFTDVLMLADETALPAVARWLEELPRGATGLALIEVHDLDEVQPIDAPAGIEVRWLSRDGAAAGTTSLLADALAAVEPRDDVWTYLWAGGEAGCLKPVRRWARAHGFAKTASDVTGYWKVGRTNAVTEPGVVDRVVHAARHALRLEHDH